MSMLCCVFGSGISEHPVLFESLALLSLCGVFGLLAYITFIKHKKTLKRVYGVAFIVLAACSFSCFLFACFNLAKVFPKRSKPPVIEKIKYENHDYLLFKSGKFSSSVIHDPDCFCRKGVSPKQ